MTPIINWKPQKTSAHGDFVAQAFLNLLSRGSDHHSLSEPELLVRETAQNSWDARRPTTRSVSMGFDVTTVAKGSPIHTALAEFFSGFTQTPTSQRPKTSCLDLLTKVLRRPELALLFVADRGTFGLGGPTDASVAVDAGKRGSDRYVKFLLNIGDANTDTTAGGAYGLGRSVFWRMSECSTAIVYSRCDVDGDFQSRLIGLSLSEKFALGGKNYTGRHWWTSKAEGQPLVGTAADRWAKSLGFTQFGAEETGTAVLVVAPFAPKGARDLACAIARSIEYHLWPKYVNVAARPQGPPMQFSVHLGDDPVQIRDRAALSASPLGAYISAFDKVLTDAKRRVRTDEGLVRGAPLIYEFRKLAHPNHLGHLAATVFTSVEPTSVRDEESLEAPIAAAIAQLGNSIALMRSPDLVVTYKPVEPSADPNIKIAGVFKSSDHANGFFRASETSTHSEWDHRIIPAADGVVIKRFHDELARLVKTWYPGAGLGPVSPVAGKLAIDRISEQLGGWLGSWGLGEGDVDDDPAEGSDGGGDSSPKRRRTAVSIGEPVLAVVDDDVVVNKWTVSIAHGGAFRLKIEIKEAGEDGRSVRTPTVARGARPSLRLVAADSKFRHGKSERDSLRLWFPDGARAVNTVSCELAFKPKATKGLVTVEVQVVFDQGTVPVLGADATDDVSDRMAPA